MGNSSMNGIFLIDLPADIIRIIIQMIGPVHRIKLISPTWHAMVIEYLNSKRKGLPAMQCVTLEVIDNTILRIRLTLPIQYLEHFGFEQRKVSVQFKDENMVWVDFPELRIDSGKVKKSKKLVSEAERARKRLKILFESCSFIKYLWIRDVNGTTFKQICDFLGAVRIGEMAVHAIEKSDIIEMARALRVENNLEINGDAIQK